MDIADFIEKIPLNGSNNLFYKYERINYKPRFIARFLYYKILFFAKSMHI